MPPASLGHFELLILGALLRLGDQAYGVRIRQEVAARSGHDAAIGAIYTTLSRLEGKGLVVSRLGEPTPERGGRAKRFYDLTAEGERAMRRTVRALSGMLGGLELGWGERS